MPDINEIGLCLSGGGAKGAFQVGVFKALKKYGLVEHITAVSGTSAGALNAVLFMGKNFDNIEKLWRSFTIADFVGIPQLNKMISTSPTVALTLAGEGVFNQKVIERLLKSNVDMYKICKNKIDCYVTCIENYSINPVTEFYLNAPNKWTPCHMRKIVLASAAIPGVYSSININGRDYNDGGTPIRDPKKMYEEGKGNVPYNILLEKGYKNLIVIDYMQQQIVEKENVNIINITPPKKCKFTDTVNFNKNKISEFIESGYNEACKVFNENYALIEKINAKRVDKNSKATEWGKSKNISDFKEFTTAFGKCNEIIVTGKLAKGIKVLYSLDGDVIANQVGIISLFTKRFGTIFLTPIAFMGITSLGLLPGIGLPLASALIILYRKLGNKLLDYIISYELYDTDEKDRAILYRRIIK